MKPKDKGTTYSCVHTECPIRMDLQVIDPVQAAKLIVGAFPWSPDLLSVISCLDKEG